MNDELYGQIVEQLNLSELVKPLLDEVLQAYAVKQVDNVFQCIVNNPNRPQVVEWVRVAIKQAFKNKTQNSMALCKAFKEMVFTILLKEYNINLEPRE